jgi:hypothetical protein
MPLTFLDHRLVVGDSLTGPFWEKLVMRPSSPKEPVEGIFHQGLTLALQKRLAEALSCVRHLEATVGISLAEVQEKERMKDELDQALRPFRIIAAAWSGGVMLGPKKCDDLAYGELLASVAKTGDIPACIESDRLRTMIARGLGINLPLPLGEGRGEGGWSREQLYALLDSGRCVPALSFDLTFPEAFYPTGVPYQPQGFDVVLGNPPWDQPEVSEPEYWAQYDLRAVEARLQRDRDAVIDELRQDDERRLGWELLAEGVDASTRLTSALYAHQSADVEGKSTVGRPDVFRVFGERVVQLCSPNGSVGEVFPSAFHANEGTTGLRRLFLNATALRFCYSFENKRALFEIHRSFKFAVVVASRCSEGTRNFAAGFYLHDDEWLFSDIREKSQLIYDRSFVELSGGPHLAFIECRNRFGFALLKTLFERASTTWGRLTELLNVEMAFGVELHRNREYAVTLDNPEHATTLWSTCRTEGWIRLPVVEGKSLWQFQDYWQSPIRLAPPATVALAKRHWRQSTPFYRLVFRRVAASTNERTFIATVIPCAFVCDNTLAVETTPNNRPDCVAILLCSVGDSFAFDYVLRPRVGATVNAFIVAPVPVPEIRVQRPLLVHHGLRLLCNHSGYEPLWREQVGDAWREPGKEPFTWPVLAGDDERWEVRAAIDAVVADAYGLSRDQYAHVLSTFSHKSYPKAPELCLARFDELKQLGLDAFTRKYDPYHDIPLNENLPQPVIDLPIPGEEQAKVDGTFQLTGTSKPRKGRGRRS